MLGKIEHAESECGPGRLIRAYSGYGLQQKADY